MVFISSIKTKEKQKKDSRYLGFLCFTLLYSIGALYITYIPSADDFAIVYPVVWIIPIISILLSIFTYIKKKKEDTPPPQEIPFKPE